MNNVYNSKDKKNKNVKKRIVKIVIWIVAIYIFLLAFFGIMGLDKSWINLIDETDRIELMVTYGPIDVYEPSPEIVVDPSTYDELKSLFEDVVCLRSFEGRMLSTGKNSYVFTLYFKEGTVSTNEEEPISIKVSRNSYITYFNWGTGERKSYKILTRNFEYKLLKIIGDELPPPVLEVI